MSHSIVSLMASIFQLCIAFGLLNVWIVRSGRATKYRGASAKNMKEEFSAYGLPEWFMYIVGFLKISIALVLLMSFITSVSPIIKISALLVLCVLMVGAVMMHMKVKDSFMKALPAIGMFLMSAFSIYFVV